MADDVGEKLEALVTELRDHRRETEQRFDRNDQRFEKIDQRFEKIDQRFEKIDQRFEKIDQRFEKIDQRFEKLEGEVAELRSELRATEQRLVTAINTEMTRGLGVIEERFTELFGLLDDKYRSETTALRRDLDGHVNDTTVHVQR